MAMQGMDTGEVRVLAQQLHQASTDITTLVSTLTQRVKNAPWDGPDRERGVADWQSHHVTALNTVAQALSDAGTLATTNAQQQDDASNA